MSSEGKGRDWVNGDIQCTLYMYLMYIYYQMYSKLYMLNNPCSMDPFFFKMKHQQIF